MAKIGTFQGFAVERDDDGWFWRHGGFFETRRECENDIASWNNEQGGQEVPEDTPALLRPWWETER